ncbi:MAG: YggS family pyridoxal phosphate-dependent enzyme [Hyphomicrobiales bacterium]|nr:YggS family pyridoxal phosphate-dependent enzyme [Hyphomicrobiales bacterium]
MTPSANIVDDVWHNLAEVKGRILTAAREAERNPGDITLVAVSKLHSVEAIRAAIAAGQRVFGENRLQEALGKWPDLKAAFPDVRLHLIGPLQRNKARKAVQLCDVIETLDRDDLAQTLARVMDEERCRPDVFVQVNTGEEPQKAGVAPAEAEDFVRRCVEVHGLPVRGLMCIPPAGEDPALHFALLREIAKRAGVKGLSMGMSADYDTAIRFGATLVRVGTAIFGARPKPQD